MVCMFKTLSRCFVVFPSVCISQTVVVLFGVLFAFLDYKYPHNAITNKDKKVCPFRLNYNQIRFCCMGALTKEVPHVHWLKILEFYV